MHKRQKYADLLLEVLYVCVKDMKQKTVFLKFREENIASAKRQAEYIVGIRTPFVKMFHV